METMQNILTRRSVRKFADKPIEPDKLHTILEAAMSGPCAVNAREWAFIEPTGKSSRRWRRRTDASRGCSIRPRRRFLSAATSTALFRPRRISG